MLRYQTHAQAHTTQVATETQRQGQCKALPGTHGCHTHTQGVAWRASNAVRDVLRLHRVLLAGWQHLLRLVEVLQRALQVLFATDRRQRHRTPHVALGEHGVQLHRLGAVGDRLLVTVELHQRRGAVAVELRVVGEVGWVQREAVGVGLDSVRPPASCGEGAHGLASPARPRATHPPRTRDAPLNAALPSCLPFSSLRIMRMSLAQALLSGSHRSASCRCLIADGKLPCWYKHRARRCSSLELRGCSGSWSVVSA